MLYRSVTNDLEKAPKLNDFFSSVFLWDHKPFLNDVGDVSENTPATIGFDLVDVYDVPCCQGKKVLLHLMLLLK